jgi:hypothetical protein
MLLEHADESLAALHEGVTARRVAASPTQTPASGDSSAAVLVSAFHQRATVLLDASAQADGDVLVTSGGHHGAAFKFTNACDASSTKPRRWAIGRIPS